MNEEERRRVLDRMRREEFEAESALFDPESVRLSRAAARLRQESDGSDYSSSSGESDGEESISSEESSYISEEESSFIRFNKFLEYLDIETAHLLSSEIYRLNEQLDSVPVKQLDSDELIMTSPSKVVVQFLAELPIDDSLLEIVNKPEVDLLLNCLLNESKGKEFQMAQLHMMATCLGDYSTLEKEFLKENTSFNDSESVRSDQELVDSNLLDSRNEESNAALVATGSTSEEEKTFVPFNEFLVYLYGDAAAHDLSSGIFGLNTELDSVPIKKFNSKKKKYETIITSPSKVVEEFLAKLPIDNPLSDIIYNPTVELLLTDVMDKSKGKDAQMSSLCMIATSLGDCPTPAKDLLTQIYIGECLKTKDKLSDFENAIIEREAVQKYILKELSSLLIKGDEVHDKIEQVNALLLSIYDAKSENDKSNPIPIKGPRERLPPKSDNIDFAYAQVKGKKDLIEAFAKIVCVTTSDGKPAKYGAVAYRLDRHKIRAISEQYLASLNHISDREKCINFYKLEMDKLISSSDHKHLSFEHHDNKVVKRLINVSERQKALRTLLLSVEFKDIENTYIAFLEKDKQELKQLSKELKEAPAINDEFSAGMVNAKNKNDSRDDKKTTKTSETSDNKKPKTTKGIRRTPS